MKLINLSGGLDSTYVLWDYLKNNPKEKFLVHHCKLNSNQRRMEAETIAVGEIIKWLKDNGLSNFEYVETSFSLLGRDKLYDFNVIYWIVSQMLHLKSFEEVDTIITSFNATDVLANKAPRFFEYYYNIKKELNEGVGFWSAKDRKIKMIHPIKDVSKTEVMQRLPKELRKLCWFCATPKYKEGKPVACRACNTCYKVYEK